jgi:hypothetical protein
MDEHAWVARWRLESRWSKWEVGLQRGRWAIVDCPCLTRSILNLSVSGKDAVITQNRAFKENENEDVG